MMMNRGSEWRRWDLHVHTKGTNKNDCYSCGDIGSFCKLLFKKAVEKKVFAVGITDYFSIDRYLEVKEYKDNIHANPDFTENEKELIQSILLLPNVELRILPVTGKERLINIHCIFNPDFVGNLDNDFFGSLSFKVSGQDFKMNRAGLIGLGKHYNIDLDDNAAYKIGVEHFAVGYDRVQELFENNEKLRENTLIVVSNSKNDGNSGLQQHYDLFVNENGSLDEVRRAIYTLSDCIFSANPSDINYFTGSGVDTKEEVIKKIRSLKPCIHGCDAHEESRLFEPDERRYCWIKSDLTFNGLKQILYEPEERVRIQEIEPERKNSYQLIDSITLCEDGFWEDTLYFNKNLNAIIGGRSTGKSTLLASIAKKINPNIILNNDRQNNFVNNHLASVSIKWVDDTPDGIRDIEYYPQGYLYEIASSKQKADQLVAGIVAGSDKGEFLNSYSNECEELKKKLSHDLLDLFQNETFVKQFNKKLLEAGNKGGVEAEIKRLKEQIDETAKASGMSNTEQEEFNDMENQIAGKKKRIEDCEKDIELFKRMETTTPFKFSYPEEFGFNKLSSINLNNYELAREYKNLVIRTEMEWTAIAKRFREKTEETLKNLNDEVLSQQAKPIYQRGLNFIKSNSVLAELKTKLNTEEEKLGRIQNLEKELNEYIKTQTELKQQIIQCHLQYLQYINNLVENLTVRFDEIGINVARRTKVRELLDFIEARFNRMGGERKQFIEHISRDYDCKTQDVCRDFLDKALNNEIDLKVGYTIDQVTTEFFQTNWFEPTYQINYQGDTFGDMSEGKKAFVVLKLLLDFSKKECPILLDQPEDSLDNRAIYIELVEYIKTKKKQRQIIIVTHNPNLVVGADSENVIVANQHGSNSKNRNDLKFHYVNGSLEDTRKKIKGVEYILESQGIREHVCEILEGGDDAFKKREAKYGFTLKLH